MNTNLALNNSENGTQEANGTAPAAIPLTSLPPPAPSSVVGPSSLLPSSPSAAMPTLPPPRHSRNRPRSNIALLPSGVREMVNQALREGMIYEEIITRVGILVGEDHGVNCSNLSRRYKTGCQDWLREKNRLENTIAQGDAVLTRLARLKAETGADLPDLTAAFLAPSSKTPFRTSNPTRSRPGSPKTPKNSSASSPASTPTSPSVPSIPSPKSPVFAATSKSPKKPKPPPKPPPRNVPAQRIDDAEMFRKCTGTPLDLLTAGLKARASAQKPKKRRRTSAEQPQIQPASSSSVAPGRRCNCTWSHLELIRK